MPAPLDVISDFLIVPPSLAWVPLREDGLPNLDVLNTEELAVLHGAVGEASERAGRVIRSGEVASTLREAEERRAEAQKAHRERQAAIREETKRLKEEAAAADAEAEEKIRAAEAYAAAKLRDLRTRGSLG